jgi:rod shape-determining protein MreD
MNAISRGLMHLIIGFIVMALLSTLLQQMYVSNFAPDLALLVALWIALNVDIIPGAITCALLGFLKDGFTPVPVGMHMEIFVLIFFVGRFLVGRVRVKGMGTLVIASMLASLLASLLFALLSLIFDPTYKDFINFDLIFRLMGPQALVTAPFAPFIFFLLNWVDRWVRPKGSDSLFFS